MVRDTERGLSPKVVVIVIGVILAIVLAVFAFSRRIGTSQRSSERQNQESQRAYELMREQAEKVRQESR